jgi:hypothetical protein
MEFIILEFSADSCHFLSLRYKYSPHHPVFVHLRSVQIMILRDVTQRSVADVSEDHAVSKLSVDPEKTTCSHVPEKQKLNIPYRETLLSYTFI